MPECGCTDRSSEACDRPDHNHRLLIVRCDQCKKEQLYRPEKRCRCGCLYVTFVRVV